MVGTYQDLIHESYNVLISEGRARDRKLLEPIIEWADEVSLENILERYNLMAGNLMSVKSNLERTVTFVGVIEIKREPKKTAQEYLDIIKKLDMLLNQPCLSKTRRNGYCKSQRYFMKLYLNMLDENNDV